jgi:hypothetical protein
MTDSRYHNYELKSFVVKEKDQSIWAMVCYDSIKNKSMENEFKKQLKKYKKNEK